MDGMLMGMLKKVAPGLLKDADIKLHTKMDEKKITNINIDVPRLSETVVIRIEKSEGLPTDEIHLKKNELDKLIALL